MFLTFLTGSKYCNGSQTKRIHCQNAGIEDISACWSSYCWNVPGEYLPRCKASSSNSAEQNN